MAKQQRPVSGWDGANTGLKGINQAVVMCADPRARGLNLGFNIVRFGQCRQPLWALIPHLQKGYD